ncbi:MAG: nicotinamide mononucleotide transporter [Bacteroidetes bacterium]|nr:nicotinamide mononucleotide transporter [Bacteroidota bacterium]
MSYVEFFGTVAGMIAVWISARGSVLSWPIGIINVVLLFFLFYQVQLYPDMLLQVYFLFTNLLGWWRWKNPQTWESNSKNELRESFLSDRERLLTVVLIVSGTIVLGAAASRLNLWFPFIFQQPGSFPIADSFVTITSILAQYWMVHKKADCWILWILADLVATVLYFMKDIKFLSLEYLIFCFIALFGFFQWRRQAINFANSND